MTRNTARLPRILLCTSLFFAVAAAFPVAPAQAEEVTEPGSGHRFQTPLSFRGQSYTLLGTGLRKKFIVKVYAMGLYMEAAAGKQEAAKLGDKDKAPALVAASRAPKLAILHFVRTVDKGKIQETYKESLAGALSEKASPDLRRDAQAFIDLFDRDVKEGQEIRIHSDESGKLSLEIAGQKKDGPTSLQLSRAIWEIWLGSKPISKELRSSLVERTAELGR